MPGVQNPHCNACSRLKAARSSTAISSLSSPSMVVTSAPPQAPAKVMHERTGSPSTSSVQAPQTPCSHPRCVPVRLSVSRRKSARCRRGSTSAETARPLTLNESGIIGARVAFMPRPGPWPAPARLPGLPLAAVPSHGCDDRRGRSCRPRPAKLRPPRRRSAQRKTGQWRRQTESAHPLSRPAPPRPRRSRRALQPRSGSITTAPIASANSPTLRQCLT